MVTAECVWSTDNKTPPKKTAAPAKPAAKPASKPASKTTATKKPEAAKAAAKAPAAAAAPPPPPEITSISLKAINSTLEGVKESSKWPLIIDELERVSTFFRHRDVNYLQSIVPGDITPDKLRLALLGAIRYGKPLVLDVGSRDLTEVDQLNDVEKGLVEALLNKSLLKEERFMSLVKPEDDPEYANSIYYRPDDFSLIIVACKSELNPVVASQMVCFKIE